MNGLSLTEGRTHPLPEVQAKAPGKAILIGEHAVVYGARAVAMPLKEMHMKARLTRTDRTGAGNEPVIRVLLQGRPVNDHLKGVVDDAFRALEVEPFGLDLEGQSSIHIGAGLGSSASLCIVILKAVARAAGVEIDGARLAALGTQLERRFHGNPSGLDTAVVAHEQVIGFAKGRGATPLAVKGRWRFALLDSGARSSTLAMIQIAAPYFQGEGGEARVAAFDAEAQNVMTALATGNQAQAADAMNRAGAWLAEAGVVNDPLRDLIVLAREIGCPAAKPTGSGGGGCIIALLDEEKGDAQLEELRRRLGEARVTAVEVPT